jgi:hypothetical protein
MYAKLSAEPLQTVNGHILKQTVGRLNARSQPPTDSILELLQRDATGTTLLVNEAHQLGG